LNTKTCIIIAGPTAVGKTSVGIEVARHFNTSIISADSRQCYKELNIGVAKPSEAELLQVPHFFISTHSVNDNLTAVDFEHYALLAINKIFTNNDIAVIVGGTGLYIKAFCEGLDSIPKVPSSVRDFITEGYEQNGLEWLIQMIKEKDPLYYNSGEILNPQRVMRALEIVLSTGESILSYQKGVKKNRNFNIVKIALELPRNVLYDKINLRVEDMMKLGLLDEVRGLIGVRHLNALQTVGYRELFEYIDGKITLEEAVGLIQQNSRHYAKRQLTWFRKDADFKWMPPDSANVIDHVKQLMK
jgi:tRNA dimethylallyltransferase